VSVKAEEVQTPIKRNRLFYLITPAALALNMSQPTVGRQVSALVEELGITLFERTNSVLVLTQGGADLMVQVKAMAEAATNFSRLAPGHIETAEGIV